LIVDPVTIVLWLNVGCMPLLYRKQLSQKAVLYIISLISQFGYFSKGKVLIVAHALSFMVVPFSLWEEFISGCNVAYYAL